MTHHPCPFTTRKRTLLSLCVELGTLLFLDSGGRPRVLNSLEIKQNSTLAFFNERDKSFTFSNCNGILPISTAVFVAEALFSRMVAVAGK